jgi:hypothetical protein
MLIKPLSMAAIDVRSRARGGTGDPIRDCLLIQTGVYSLFANSEY